MKRFRILVAALAMSMGLDVVPALAQEAGDINLRVGIARTKLVDKGEVRADGALDPNAGYSTRESWHGEVSGSYFVMDRVALDASISTPATTNNMPAGSLHGVPNLGDDEFIMATVGASIHPIKGPISPYVGAGMQFQITTQERDAYAVGLNIPNANGPYVKGGVNVALSKRLGVFAEVRKAFYHTNAGGLLPTGVAAHPYSVVDAKAQLDPITFQIGMTARFGKGAADNQPPVTAENRGLVVKLGMTALRLADQAKLNAGGAPLAGASLSTFEHGTPTVQLGYFLTPNIAVNAIGGLPPKIDIYGAGSIGPATIGADNKVGKLTYGPMALTLQYHPITTGRVRPYVGAGISYMLVFKTKDAAMQDLKVSNDIGPAFEAGVEVLATNKVGVFLDVKKALLRPKASGRLGTIPVTGRAKTDPLAMTAGLSFRF